MFKQAFLLNAKDNDINGSLKANPPFDRWDISVFIGMYYHFSEKISLNSRFEIQYFQLEDMIKNEYLYLKEDSTISVLSFTLHYYI